MKNIVLIYSYDHFTPGKESKHEKSSANIISNEIYYSLIKNSNFNVYYFDSRRLNEWLPIKADILISIIDNIRLSQWFFKPKRTVLIAVNKSPLTRLSLLRVAKSKNLPINALAGHDGIYDEILSLRKVDMIALLGNDFTIESYRTYYKTSNIFLFHYNSYNFQNDIKTLINPDQNLLRKGILISMSSLGFRKNFHFIQDFIRSYKQQLKEYDFYIVGSPANTYWSSIIEEISQQFNVINLGWIPNLSLKQYEISNILPKIRIALFPTLEEGSPGTMLDCINFGILCIHNFKNSGINNSIELLHSEFIDREEVFNKVIKIMELDTDDYLKIQQLQLDQLNSFFSKTKSINDVTKLITADNFVTSKIKLKFLRIFLDYIKLPFVKYDFIFLRRFFVHVIRFRLNKIKLLKAKLKMNDDLQNDRMQHGI
jgi:hypothetical protein